MIVLLVACGERVDGGGPQPLHVGGVALNGALVVSLAEEPDPLSVTDAAVRVSDGRGRVLPVRTRVEGRTLVTQLVIDASLLADPPDEVRVSVLGGASLVGLCTRDGAALPSVSARFVVRATLEDAPGGALDLCALARLAADGNSSWETPLFASASGPGEGTPLDEFVLAPEDRLVLRFAGVFDPSGLDPQSVPLFPVGAAGELPAVHPEYRWTIVGMSSELLLDLTGQAESLRFKSRRMTLRSLSGREAEPRIEILVRRDLVR